MRHLTGPSLLLGCFDDDGFLGWSCTLSRDEQGQAAGLGELNAGQLGYSEDWPFLHTSWSLHQDYFS